MGVTTYHQTYLGSFLSIEIVSQAQPQPGGASMGWNMGYILTINHLSLYIYIYIYMDCTMIYIQILYIYIYVWNLPTFHNPVPKRGHRRSAQRGPGDAVAQGLSAGRLPQAARFDAGGAAVAGDEPLGVGIGQRKWHGKCHVFDVRRQNREQPSKRWISNVNLMRFKSSADM